MYKNELDSLLRQSPPRVSLLYGDEFLIGHYARKIAQALKSEEKVSFYFDEYSVTGVNALLSQGSLFGGSSLVILKLNQKLPKADVELFLRSLESNTQNALIVEFYQSSSKSNADYAKDYKVFAGYFKKLEKRKFGKNEVVDVRFFKPNTSESMNFMRARSKELGLMIEEKLLAYILLLQNNDLSLALNELEKFVILKQDKYSHTITPSDVNLLCDGLASFSVEELCHKLMEKKPFVQMLQSMYEEGVNEIAMISEIQRFFYQLFLFFAFIKIKGPPINAKEILGFIPPDEVTNRLSRYSICFKETEYMRIFELLSQWRYEVSKGKSRQSMNVLIKIQEMIR